MPWWVLQQIRRHVDVKKLKNQRVINEIKRVEEIERRDEEERAVRQLQCQKQDGQGLRHAEVPKPVIPGPGELPGEGRAPPGTKEGTPVGASVKKIEGFVPRSRCQRRRMYRKKAKEMRCG